MESEGKEQKEKKKEPSFVNDDLDQAFVEDNLNRTVSGSNGIENNNWNLLDEPELENIKHEEEDYVEEEDCLELGEKGKGGKAYNNIGGMESSIHFQNKGLLSSNLQYKKPVEEDEDDDIRDLLGEVFKGKKPAK
jgi:hypothetical protein